MFVFVVLIHDRPRILHVTSPIHRTAQQIREAFPWETAPRLLLRQLKEKYIHSAQEDRPAVMAVNNLASAATVLELLARIHPYRYGTCFAVQRFELHAGYVVRKAENELERYEVLARYVGRSDVVPLLDRPEFGEVDEAA